MNGTGTKAAAGANGGRSVASRLALVAVVLTALAFVAPPAPPATAAGGRPAVSLSTTEEGTGGDITVTGKRWRPKTLLMLLICGQGTPATGVIGGTNACANADGRAVTTDAAGAFRKRMPVVEPPKPCPCVVHVATVTGDKAVVDTIFQVAGHPVAPLPRQTGTGRLSVLTDTRLAGSGGILTWFGAPPSRSLEFTVGNVGSAPVRNPVFQVGTSHGVFAPQWEEQQWRGTIRAGRKARIELPVELAAGAHGDYLVSVKYGGKVLAEQPWGVGRPWGVTLFWLLLCVVVPAAVFRVGMAVVDRLRPRRGASRPRSGAGRPGRGTGRPGRHRGVRLSELAMLLPKPRPSARSAAEDGPGDEPRTAAGTGGPTSTLPWFTPDTTPGTPAGRLSAPSENSPMTKGNS
ncbi:hypothetical protein ACWCP6_36620 [Streptomyces sp. NPDC002004]